MPDEPFNADSDLEEQLVAYLDGELSAEAGRRIEELLACDAEVRRKLQELDHTWELLGELETSHLADDFFQTTLEMVTVSASDDLDQEQRAAPARRRRKWALVGGSLTAAALAGFLVVAALAPDPNRELIRDLPVLENLDQYRHAGDVEFLRMLHREKLFSEENGDGKK